MRSCGTGLHHAQPISLPRIPHNLPGRIMSNEYIFFDETIREQFVRFIAGYSIACSVRPDPMEGFIVELPDRLADNIEVLIEAKYEALMDEQRELVNAAEGEDSTDVMGVTVTLPNGQSCLVRLPAAYGHRLVQVFSFQEIHELVTLIAHNVSNPVEGPLCRK